jgi:hypothetical protein
VYSFKYQRSRHGDTSEIDSKPKTYMTRPEYNEQNQQELNSLFNSFKAITKDVVSSVAFLVDPI